MILTNVSDTIQADSLALFALNSEILLAGVTKPDKSNILTLTWPVTSSVKARSNFTPFLESSRTGLSNGVWILEIGPVVWEITGGPKRPPTECVTRQSPTGRGLQLTQKCGIFPRRVIECSILMPPYSRVVTSAQTPGSGDVSTVIPCTRSLITVVLLLSMTRFILPVLENPILSKIFEYEICIVITQSR